MTPYPGTAFTERAVSAGKVADAEDYSKMGGTRCLISTRYMTRIEVDRAHKWAERSLALASVQRQLASAEGPDRWILAWRLARKLAAAAAARLAFEWDARRAARRIAASPPGSPSDRSERQAS